MDARVFKKCIGKLQRISGNKKETDIFGSVASRLLRELYEIVGKLLTENS